MREDARRRERARWRSARRGRPAHVVRPGPGQESVWDYPRPPRLEPATQPVRVEFAGRVVAASTRALRLCETASPPTYYLPPADVQTRWLEPGPRQTFCEWKGVARYFTLRVGGRVSPDAAWCYPEADPPYEALRGWLSFFAGRVDACFVGDERVVPQPGDYYGGWATACVVGPFKGDPGTEGW